MATFITIIRQVMILMAPVTVKMHQGINKNAQSI